VSSRENLRASDADREQVVGRLHEAATEGRLDPDELGERLREAFTARTYADLDAVTADLPAPPEDVAGAARRVATPALPDGAGWGTASGPRAGFWKRFWALFLDNIVCWVMIVILGVVLRHGTGLVLGFILSIGYFIYFEGSQSGATPGKRAMGIRIIDERTGDPIGYGRSVVRLFGRFISGLFLDLGYLWMLWDDEKQCWHDKMSHDVVVPTSEYPVQLNR
jgi:uncharacterized RDD family membrane protein YckC